MIKESPGQRHDYGESRDQLGQARPGQAGSIAAGQEGRRTKRTNIAKRTNRAGGTTLASLPNEPQSPARLPVLLPVHHLSVFPGYARTRLGGTPGIMGT